MNALDNGHLRPGDGGTYCSGCGLAGEFFALLICPAAPKTPPPPACYWDMRTCEPSEKIAHIYVETTSGRVLGAVEQGKATDLWHTFEVDKMTGVFVDLVSAKLFIEQRESARGDFFARINQGAFRQ